eukprot:scaffold256153_cov46-Prasinocladus_malaysianus.AAC.1
MSTPRSDRGDDLFVCPPAPSKISAFGVERDIESYDDPAMARLPVAELAEWYMAKVQGACRRLLC